MELVGLQCEWVTVMVWCLNGKVTECIQLHSAIVQEVKNASTELCKAMNF